MGVLILQGNPTPVTWCFVRRQGLEPPNPRGPDPATLIPLTRNEIAHLTATITRPAHDARHRLRWSRWRRRHQHRSRTCHYQRQTAHDQGI
jgi:hypothetical protein